MLPQRPLPFYPRPAAGTLLLILLTLLSLGSVLRALLGTVMLSLLLLLGLGLAWVHVREHYPSRRKRRLLAWKLAFFFRINVMFFWAFSMYSIYFACLWHLSPLFMDAPSGARSPTPTPVLQLSMLALPSPPSMVEPAIAAKPTIVEPPSGFQVLLKNCRANLLCLSLGISPTGRVASPQVTPTMALFNALDRSWRVHRFSSFPIVEGAGRAQLELGPDFCLTQPLGPSPGRGAMDQIRGVLIEGQDESYRIVEQAWKDYLWPLDLRRRVIAPVWLQNLDDLKPQNLTPHPEIRTLEQAWGARTAFESPIHIKLTNPLKIGEDLLGLTLQNPSPLAWAEEGDYGTLIKDSVSVRSYRQLPGLLPRDFDPALGSRMEESLSTARLELEALLEQQQSFVHLNYDGELGRPAILPVPLEIGAHEEFSFLMRNKRIILSNQEAFGDIPEIYDAMRQSLGDVADKLQQSRFLLDRSLMHYTFMPRPEEATVPVAISLQQLPIGFPQEFMEGLSYQREVSERLRFITNELYRSLACI